METASKRWKLIYHGIFIGIVIHGFILVNDMPNWDDLGQMYTDLAYAKVSGRWFLSFPSHFSSPLGMNWVNGLLSIFYISISAWLVSRTLEIRSILNNYMLTVIMLAFPTVSSTLFYTQCADGYFFGLLLSSLSAYLINGSCLYKFEHNKTFYFVGILSCFLSLGIYQAYFPFGCTVLIISIILRILIQNEKAFTLLKLVLKVIVAEAVSLFGYIIFTKIIMKDQLSDYMGISSMGDITLLSLIERIKNSYKEFIEFFYIDSRFMHGKFTTIIILSSLICIILILWNIYKTKIYTCVLNLYILMLLLTTFPMACNLIYLFGSKSVHLLMIYGLVSLFVLEIAVLDLTIRRKELSKGIIYHLINFLCILSAGLLCLIGYKYTLNDNMVYYTAHISYEQTYAYAERLVSRIESLDGYRSDDKIFLMGKSQFDFEKTDTAWMTENMFNQYTGIPTSLVKNNKITIFINAYLGSQNKYEWLVKEKCDNIKIISEYEQMSNYPDDGSVLRMDNGTILVKFSE